MVDDIINGNQEACVSTIKILAEYQAEQASIRESIKETLDDFIAEVNADKDDAAALKKHIKKAATVFYKRQGEEVREEHGTLEYLLELIENKTTPVNQEE